MPVQQPTRRTRCEEEEKSIESGRTKCWVPASCMCLRESVKSVCRNNRHITQSCLQQLLRASTFSFFPCSSTVNCLAWARPRAAMATASFIALLRARRGGQPNVHPAKRCAPHRRAALCPEPSRAEGGHSLVRCARLGACAGRRGGALLPPRGYTGPVGRCGGAGGRRIGAKRT